MDDLTLGVVVDMIGSALFGGLIVVFTFSAIRSLLRVFSDFLGVPDRD